MAAEPKTIEVEPGSELDRVLDEVAGGPVRLVRNGERFRVDREGNAVTHDEAMGADPADRRPSPEQAARSLAGIRAAAGAWVGLVDAEAFKAYVRERRRTANRPPVHR